MSPGVLIIPLTHLEQVSDRFPNPWQTHAPLLLLILIITMTIPASAVNTINTLGYCASPATNEPWNSPDEITATHTLAINTVKC